MISGPTSVAGSSGSPSTSASMAVTRRGTQVVVQRRVGEHALHRDARLPGLVVAERRDARRRPVEVGRRRPVGADQRRRVAAELERDVLVRHRLADRVPTGPDPVNETTGSRGSATRAGARSSGTRIDRHCPAGRSVSAKISPSSKADSGVLGAGLTTIGRTDGDGGRDLVSHQVEREVERRDAEHRPARESADERQASRRLPCRCRGAGPLRSSAGPPRRPSGTSRPPRATSATRPLQRLAGLGGDQARRPRRRARRAGRLTWSSAAARTWAGTAATSALAAAAVATAASTSATAGPGHLAHQPAVVRAADLESWTRCGDLAAGETMFCGFRGKESLSHRIPSQYRGRHD